IGLLILALVMEPSGLEGMAEASDGVYAVLFMSGIVATGSVHMVFNSAIQKIEPSKTTIFNNFMPFFGVNFSVIFLKEVININQIIGFVFIVTGVLFGTGYIERVLKKRKLKELEE